MSQTCPRHPGVPSTDLCVECGDFVCGQCGVVLADRRVLCTNCSANRGVAVPGGTSERRAPSVVLTDFGKDPTQGPKPSAKAIIALILGMVSCFCLPGAIAGLVLALIERKAIQEGRSATNPRLVTIAIALNVLSIAVALLILLIPKK